MSGFSAKFRFLFSIYYFLLSIYDIAFISMRLVRPQNNHLRPPTKFLAVIFQVLFERHLVVTQSDNVGLVLFHDLVNAEFSVAERDLVNKRFFSQVVNSPREISLRQTALQVLSRMVLRDCDEQIMAVFPGLFKKLTVTFMDAVKNAEDQNFFHVSRNMKHVAVKTVLHVSCYMFHFFGRISGKITVSRTGLSIKIANRRSDMPKPAAGGIPYSIASK